MIRITIEVDEEMETPARVVASGDKKAQIAAVADTLATMLENCWKDDIEERKEVYLDILKETFDTWNEKNKH